MRDKLVLTGDGHICVGGLRLRLPGKMAVECMVTCFSRFLGCRQLDVAGKTAICDFSDLYWYETC